jgi:3D (Asp-Asp-Asp) domain-containing protein
VLAAGFLSAIFLGASFGTHPAAAYAATADAVPATPAAHSVTLSVNGSSTNYQTAAATVGDFLRERNITVAPGDVVEPAIDAPITDGLTVTYRSAAPQPQASSAPAETWIRDEKRAVKAPTIHRFDYSMTPGTSKTISPGRAGERDTIVRYTRGEDGSVQRWVVASHVTRAPHPRIVAIGVDENQMFARLEAHGVMRMSQLAASAMHMVATAYTANCGGCGGMTASGRPAGHGVVAVDPRVIPLGTRLFIPGYGPAVAGDTGGAIHGLRIDLGFNSLREALLFGRREVTVYRLK